MTNFEKYHQEIIENGYTAVKGGRLAHCGETECCECDLHCGDELRSIKLIKWLAEEYKEPKPTLTKQQRLLCELLSDGWIVRRLNGELWYYRTVPTKYGDTWIIYRYDKPIAFINTDVFPDFPLIRWEDEKPHSVEDMLTWEVEE